MLFGELDLVEGHGADLNVAAGWTAMEEFAPRAAVMSAAAIAVTLMPEHENTADVVMGAALATRYATVRPFLALLGESKALDAASAEKRVLARVRGLSASSDRYDSHASPASTRPPTSGSTRPLRSLPGFSISAMPGRWSRLLFVGYEAGLLLFHVGFSL